MSVDTASQREAYDNSRGGSTDVSIVDKLKFYYFHHHHYLDVPADRDQHPATWVVYPNRLFDPEKGHKYYERHLRTVILAETLGFDGITINEHHNTTYSMTPTVSLMGAAIATNTSRARILVAGVPVNLAYPNRVAEEYAMLDVLSGGRMEFAFPLGTGMEYWSNAGTINPVTARARFRESLEVIMKAWTQDGPFARRRLLLVSLPESVASPVSAAASKALHRRLREPRDRRGRCRVRNGLLDRVHADREPAARVRPDARAGSRERAHGRFDDLIVNVVAYVADSDAEAVREARPYIETFWSWYHRVPQKFLLPPGYVSREEFLRRASDAALSHGTEASWEDMVAIGRIACGSPDTVADTIVQWAEDAGCSRSTSCSSTRTCPSG